MIGVEEIDRKYDVLEKLGEGGMGTVYKVRHRYLDELRVIKTIKAKLNVDEDLQQRFLREAQVAAKLRHPNIAAIHDFSVGEDGTAYISMEYIEGMNLRQYQKSKQPLSLAQVVEIGRQTLAALAYLHSKQFVHRDISTDNMMLSWDNGHVAVKLIDLGLAKSLENEQQWQTQTGMVVGKVRYISPEQLNAGMSGAGVDHRSDLYSFGVVLYELLTRQFPITGADEMSMIAGHLYRPPKSFDETDPRATVPIPLRGVVLKALEKDPSHRFASADDFSRALTTSVHGAASVAAISAGQTTELGPGLSQQITQSAGLAQTRPISSAEPQTVATVPGAIPQKHLDASLSDLESAPTATIVTGDELLPETFAIEAPDSAAIEAPDSAAIETPDGAATELLASPTKPAHKRTSRRGMLVAAMVAVATIVALAVGWFGTQRQQPGNAIPPSSGHSTPASPTDTGAAGIFFGTNHALVIGNNNYRELPPLETAINDARAVADILERRYNFEVLLLEDVERSQLISALHELNERLTARDNLLVYYAGHGQLQGQSEYWQPIDAQPDRTTQWISTRFEISATLKQSAARHILIVADSCYSGAMANTGWTFNAGESGEPIRDLVKRPSRLVLASGGLSPVLDTGDARHSLFARVLLEELRNNQDIIGVSSLFPTIRDQVARIASLRGGEQVPVLAPIPDSLDEGGEFFFVPNVSPMG